MAKLGEQIGRIEQKLDTIIKQGEDHAKRIRDLEDNRTWKKGIWFTVLLVLGSAGSVSMIVIGILTLIKSV